MFDTRDGNGARSKPRRRARRAGGFGDPCAELRLVGERVTPMALAREQTLPVLGPLAPLFPEGALRRGSIVGIRGSGATSLAMAVAAGPSTSGAWTAVVGDPDLGLAAVGELGVALERLLIVRPEPGNWSSALAALVGAVDVVIAAPGTASATPMPAHGGSSTGTGLGTDPYRRSLAGRCRRAARHRCRRMGRARRRPWGAAVTAPRHPGRRSRIGVAPRQLEVLVPGPAGR